MRRKLYGNKVNPACETCRFGQVTVDGRAILCSHRGAMPRYAQCRRYTYDPLKRVPHHKAPQTAYDPADFSLE